MSAQNNPNIAASSSILYSPSQSERLSSKFLRKSKFLMKSNLNPDNPDRCGTTSTSDSSHASDSSVPPLTYQQPPSFEIIAPDIKSITRTPRVGLHTITTEKILRAAKNLQESKQAASSTPLSPENHPPPTPLKEIIPSPLSHQVHVTTPLENATLVASSDDDFASTPELQSLTEIQNTPLTEGQIDDAKGLVLDLLGWGVSPEYLVTSGVHPELIYRIFTDLNLRLPANLALFDDGLQSCSNWTWMD